LKNHIKSTRKRFAEVPGFTTRIKHFAELNIRRLYVTWGAQHEIVDVERPITLEDVKEILLQRHEFDLQLTLFCLQLALVSDLVAPVFVVLQIPACPHVCI
jgi:hypothetical protein